MGNKSKGVGTGGTKKSFSQLKIDAEKIIQWNEEEFLDIQDEYYENLKDYDEYYNERHLIEGYNTTKDDLDKNMEKTLDKLSKIQTRISNDIWGDTGQSYPVYSDIDLMRGKVSRSPYLEGGKPGFLVSYDDGKMVINKGYFK